MLASAMAFHNFEGPQPAPIEKENLKTRRKLFSPKCFKERGEVKIEAALATAFPRHSVDLEKAEKHALNRRGGHYPIWRRKFPASSASIKAVLMAKKILA